MQQADQLDMLSVNTIEAIATMSRLKLIVTEAVKYIVRQVELQRRKECRDKVCLCRERTAFNWWHFKYLCAL